MVMVMVMVMVLVMQANHHSIRDRTVSSAAPGSGQKAEAMPRGEDTPVTRGYGVDSSWAIMGSWSAVLSTVHTGLGVSDPKDGSVGTAAGEGKVVGR